jgi:hypothetical protein
MKSMPPVGSRRQHPTRPRLIKFVKSRPLRLMQRLVLRRLWVLRLLLRVVPRNGVVFANGDDENVLDVIKNAPAPVVTVGFGPENNHRITDVTGLMAHVPVD